MNQIERLVREIHRRSLWQILAIYAAASWIVFEVVQTLTEGLGLPEWFPAFAFVLLLIGFPIVLATAFVQEGGPSQGEDERRSVPVRGEPGHGTTSAEASEHRGLRRFLTWRNAIVGGVLALALWGIAAAGWLLIGPDAAGGLEGDRGARAKSIAVLPFENLSPDEDDRYFADGVHDEILTHLARIGDLKVISRTSVMEYRDSPKNLREIAAELDVATVLEGTVRRAGDEVRITAQLIDATDDQHLWAETYERKLSDIFAIQAEVAQRIARALAVELTAETQARIEGRPTDDMEAYDAYLRGEEYATRDITEDNIRLAIRMYERAVESDPEFALAWATMGQQHARLYWYHFDRSDSILGTAKRAIDRALALDPELPEAYLARGFYRYWAHLDYDGALRDFARASEGLPGEAQVSAAMAYVRRRQGRWEEAADLLREALELDPRSEGIIFQLAETLELLRKYDEAIHLFDHAITLAPDFRNAMIAKARVLARGRGNLESAWATLQPTFDMPTSEYSPVFYGVLIQRYGRDFSNALEILEGAGEEVFETQFYYVPRTLVRASVLDLMARSEAALAAYDSARVLLERRLVDDPEDPRFHSALGLALAGMGLETEAIRAGERAMQILPVSQEAWRGGSLVIDHARILTRVGEAETAIDRLEQMLALPSELTPTALRLDPTWDPLREHPGFRALLARHP
ncbi:MAG: tetratricopeptide repeat protein [Longimicrobiales bacterium]|nr:tetratricopeptide repeat protein [Longimicrobiales bacterium]